MFSRNLPWLLLVCSSPTLSGYVFADNSSTNSASPALIDTNQPTQAALWNWHAQTTAIIQGDPPFPAKYSGPNSLDSKGEIRESVSVDLMAGVRLWAGAEAHVDGLLWQGFGLSQTLGVEGFPNGEAFRLGTKVPNVNIARLFLRQTIGLGGDSEPVADAP